MPSELRIPQTYAEWMPLIEILKNKADDDNVLIVMKKGTLVWQSGIAERFSKKLIDAVNFRMNAATDRFQKEMLRSHGEERAIVRALLALRKELGFLSEAVALPVIPEKDREQYRRLVIDQASSIQRSLEDSAKSDRTGKLSSIIRRNRVDSI